MLIKGGEKVEQGFKNFCYEKTFYFSAKPIQNFTSDAHD